MGFHYVGQVGLELLTSGDQLASASRSTGINYKGEPLHLPGRYKHLNQIKQDLPFVSASSKRKLFFSPLAAHLPCRLGGEEVAKRKF